MQKGLCIAALAISIIVFALFLADLVFGILEMRPMAPFKFADSSMIMDIVFMLCSLALAVMSWFTLKEQV